MHDQNKSVTRSCPFNPTAGWLPQHLAGRNEEQRDIARQLDLLTHGDEASIGTVIFGPRGNGKTALLRWAERLALAKGVDAISVASSMIETVDAVVHRLSAKPWWSGIVEAVSGLGVHSRCDRRQAPPIEEALARRLRRRPLLLSIDEAHTLDTDVGRKLMHAVQQVCGHGAGMLLLLAGTPDLPSHLGQMNSTFWERYRIWPIGRLDAEASADAVRIPLEAANRSISDEALTQVVQESHGYPFFLQLWGEVLWYEVETTERTIEMDDVNRTRPEFEKSRDLFHGLRYQELRNRHLVNPAAALASVFGNREQLAESEIVEALKTSLDGGHLPSSPDDITSLLTRLQNLGFIWSPGGSLSNRYFSGIPSLMTFVARMAST